MSDDTRNNEDRTTVWERNIARLLRGAYHPTLPRPAFRAQVAAHLVTRQALLRARAGRRRLIGIAALALLAIGGLWIFQHFIVPPRSHTVNVAALGGGDFWVQTPEAAARNDWQRHTGGTRLGVRDRLYVTRGARARVTDSQGARLDIDGPALVERKGGTTPPCLVHGSAEVAAPRERVYTLSTPLVDIRAQGAHYRVEAQLSAPEAGWSTGNETESGAMNKRVIGAAVLASAALVTVVFYNTSGRDETATLEVENAHGRDTLQAGDGVRVDRTGAITKLPGADARAAGRAGGDPHAGSTLPAPETTTVATPTAETIALHVQIDNPHGEPVAGARVLVRTKGATDAVTEGTSDDKGLATLRILETLEAADIEVSCQRYETAAISWLREDSSKTAYDSTEMPAAAGLPAGAPRETSDSTSEAAPESPSESFLAVTLVHECGIGGVVHDQAAGGEPCGEYLVAAQRIETQGWHDPIIQQIKDKTGAFYFGPLEPARYRVWAYREGRCRSAGTDVTLGAGDFKNNLRIDLEEGAALRGTVFEKRTGRAVPNAIVYAPVGHLPGTVDPTDRTTIDDRVRDAARTDDRGEFELLDLAPGRNIVFRVLHPDYKPFDFQVTLERGGDPPPVEVALAEGTGIRGSVLDERGMPLAGYVILAFSMGVNQDLAEVGVGHVDEKGEYVIRNMNPGAYILVRLKSLEDEDNAGYRIASTRVTPEADAIADFVEIPELATLRGIVRDENGEPMVGLQVSASTIQGGDLSFRNGATDDEGRFEIKNLSLTRYAISLGKSAGSSFTAVGEIDFQEARDYEQDFVFEELSVSGVITTEDGKPAEPCEIFLLAVDANGKRRFGGMIYAQAGRFRTDGVAGGTYLIMVTVPGYARAWSDPFTLDGKTKRSAEVNMTLVRGATLAVRVVRGKDEPLPGATVLILSDAGKPTNLGLPPKTEANGVYAFASLTAGVYTVKVTFGESSITTDPITISTGATSEVTVKLE